MQITASEATKKSTDSIDAAMQGEDIVITNSGSMVRLTPNTTVKRYPAKAGSAKGKV